MGIFKPQILCLHGGGTSGDIFHAQTLKLRKALGPRFEFIYVNAPIECGPGPGALPHFKDSGPYFRWFTEDSADLTKRETEKANINKQIETSVGDQGKKTANIVGVLGFSQGTIVSTQLLCQKRAGNPKWLNLRFGVLICSGGAGSDVRSIVEEPLQVPSVHVHGMKDPNLPNSRMLLECYSREHTAIMEFDGGHHIPTRMDDIRLVGALMNEAKRKNVRRKSSAFKLEPSGRAVRRRSSTKMVLQVGMDRSRRGSAASPRPTTRRGLSGDAVKQVRPGFARARSSGKARQVRPGHGSKRGSVVNRQGIPTVIIDADSPQNRRVNSIAVDVTRPKERQTSSITFELVRPQERRTNSIHVDVIRPKDRQAGHVTFDTVQSQKRRGSTGKMPAPTTLEVPIDAHCSLSAGLVC